MATLPYSLFGCVFPFLFSVLPILSLIQTQPTHLSMIVSVNRGENYLLWTRTDQIIIYSTCMYCNTVLLIIMTLW